MRGEPSPDDLGNPEAITDALCAWRNGAPDAMDRLAPLVYEQLKRIARRQLRAEAVGHTFSTTALVHEAYLKLVNQTRAEWQDRGHFFAVASGAMRRILVDYARRYRAERRGGGDDGAPVQPVPLEDTDIPVAERAEALIALDEALERLGGFDEQQARVVECRFFGGLTEGETAAALGISQRTVAREWVTARGWLYQELRRD
jgi:RNA polymerase sigma-70 factor, ECF subfamily